EATRTDLGGATVDEVFTYAADGHRVNTTISRTVNGQPTKKSTIHVNEYLVLEGAGFPDATNNFEHTASTEHLYFPLGERNVAHVFYDGTGALPKGVQNGQ